ncbi:MAG TPA: protein kinase [Armatimonadota bacterium]|nr:protein kinase [Armatimonadota bacterium]
MGIGTLVGTVLKHRYEVLEKIGEGNLFTVYKCDDKIDNRPVAAKVLLPQYAANRMFAERILVEAQAMAGVSHPGIVEVYDSGEQDGSYYVIMEYVRGVDLKERIRRSAQFSLSTAVDVGLAICDVLDFAHRRGFVHGDLRPGNVLVTPEGQIKLTDFWVGSGVASSQSIRTSAMMRSIHYMAPEVAEGKPATPAADVYSLGVVLFELLTGAIPFDGDTPIAIALKHAREPVPSLRALNPGIPKNLEAVVVKALQKAPQDRHRSAKAMLNELKSVRDALHLSRPVAWSQPAGKKAAGPPPEPEERVAGVDYTEPVFLSALRRTLLAVVLIIVVLLAVMVGYMIRRPADVRVPDLIGKALSQAQMIAADKKIQLAVRSEQFNEEYPAGTIYFMSPSPDRFIKVGKTVDVWVSKGSKFAVTPNVVKVTREEAVERIRNAGLNAGEVTQAYSDTVPADSIIGQSPSAGTRLERDQLVDLVCSLGPEPEKVSLDTENYGPSGETRSFDVRFTVPEGAEDQRVQIVVRDDYGESIAYSGVGHPGDRIQQTVQGTGDKVTIRIYIDGKLVSEEPKWR